MTNAELITIKDLKKTFFNAGKAFTALDGVSFSIAKNECVGLIGESGSGKSTVARILCRLTDADSGQVLLTGEDITSYKGRQLSSVYRKIQMIFQSPQDSFDPSKKLSYSIMEGMRNTGCSKAAAKERLAELLEMTELKPEIADRLPHEVSGGQCQRAAIARAIALSPELLICDEATSALDVTVQKQILELFRKIKKERNTSFLFICHDPALVDEFCERTIVMYRGKVVEAGLTENVLYHPEHPYTRKLLDSVL